MLWAMAAALAGIVAVAILAPFLRNPDRRGLDQTGLPDGAQLPAAAYDLRVYRAQLREVERDLARGVVAADEAGRLRTEIGRKVLEADRDVSRAQAAAPLGGDRAAPNWGMTRIGICAGMVILSVGAFAVYQQIGAPRMPDEPLSARAAAAERAYASRPSQADAEARARPTMPATVPDTGYLALIAKLREAVAQRPDDVQGLALLARHEAGLGNYGAAAAAMQRLVTVRGDAATADDHAELGGLMVEAAGGIITPEAEAELARALALDSSHPQARYMQGLLLIQNQRPDRAFPIWRAMLESSPADAPWVEPIRRVIGDLAWFAGEPDYQPPAAGTADLPTGPDAAAVAAAEGMSDEDRAQMIQGMVSQLEGRLASQGGTPEDWARLISALGVLGEDAHGAEILAEARARFAADPKAMAVIDAAAAKDSQP